MVNSRYRLLRRSRLISVRVSSRMPRIGARLPVSARGARGLGGLGGLGGARLGARVPVIFGGNREECLLKAEARYLDLAWAVAGVEHLVQGRVGVACLDVHDLAAHVEAAETGQSEDCLLYTSDAADDLLCVDLGGR